MLTWNRLIALSTGSLVVLGGLSAALSRADVVIGDWENSSTDGWIDWGTQGAIAAPTYSFATDVGVTHGSSSLKLTQSGWSQTLSIKLQDTGHTADFFANKKLMIDVSFPATTDSGWAEIYQLWINASGYSFTGLVSPAPAMQWGWGAGGGPARTSTVTFDYSALVDGDSGNGEISPTAGYVELIFGTNNDGVHTSFYFDNARLTGGTPPHFPGDTNNDGVVDLVDLNNVLNNFGAAGANPGDDNSDGTVDLVDLNNVLNNFGATQPASALSAVPEPASLAACGLALVPFLARRRRA